VFSFVRDKLIAQTRELAVEVEVLETMSEQHKVVDEVSAARSKEIILRTKEITEEVDAALGLMKKKAHMLHKGVKAAEEVLVGPLEIIETTEKRKIGAWFQAEEKRKKDEYLAQQQIELKEKDRKMKAAQKKADALLEGITGLAQQAEALEKQLENPEITQEEVDAISSKLAAVRSQLANKQAFLEQKTAEVHEIARPAAVYSEPTTAIKGASIKKEWAVAVTEPMRLLQGIVNGLVPVSVVEFSASALKKIANGGGVPSMSTTGNPVIPGCVLTEDIKVSTRR